MKFFSLKIGILVTCFLFSVTSWSQTKNIAGKVISDNGTLLAGVTISEKGKQSLATTDAKGEFAINVPVGTELIFTSTGFDPGEAKVGNSSTIEITLVTHVSKMDEVVIVGYGTQKRSKITGSVSKLDSKVLETGVRSNPLSALEGTIPGLRVQQTSGRPGSVASVVLRGGTTYGGGGTPLVIVDGILRSGFSDMNSDDIESMEVLKDAAATAIYGARASNGVILITTKKGKTGVSNITLNARYGVSKLNIPFKFLNARDYLYWSRVSIQNSGVYDAGRLSQLTSSGPFGTGNRFLDNNGNVIDGNKSSLGV